jgi:hypothetical protein
MSAVYFWRDGRVKVINRHLTVLDFEQSSMFKYLYCPCVDTHAIDLEDRYGAFVHADAGWMTKVRWDCLPLDSFPPEFRTHLLLLGLPT